MLACQKETSPPVLRLYLWEPPAVSIGYFQSTEKTVDLKKCKDRGVHVVRRITGGRAVLHEEEITYSVCASGENFPQLGANTFQTYQRLSMALLESLRLLGINGEWVKPSTNKKSHSLHQIFPKPCFVSNFRYEITVGGKKLIGSAQRRFSYRFDQHRKDSFIQHGSILTGKGKHSLAELLPEESCVEMVKQNLEHGLGGNVWRYVSPHHVEVRYKKKYNTTMIVDRDYWESIRHTCITQLHQTSPNHYLAKVMGKDPLTGEKKCPMVARDNLGTPPKMETVHVDGDSMHNCRDNLRVKVPKGTRPLGADEHNVPRMEAPELCSEDGQEYWYIRAHKCFLIPQEADPNVVPSYVTDTMYESVKVTRINGYLYWRVKWHDRSDNVKSGARTHNAAGTLNIPKGVRRSMNAVLELWAAVKGIPDLVIPDPSRTFRCEECEYAGRQKKDLIQHNRKHTGERLYCLNVAPRGKCDYSTTRESTLQRHKQNCASDPEGKLLRLMHKK